MSLASAKCLEVARLLGTSSLLSTEGRARLKFGPCLIVESSRGGLNRLGGRRGGPWQDTDWLHARVIGQVYRWDVVFGVSTFDFVFCIVRLLPGSELPDRAAAPQTAQVYAPWVGDASGTQVACKFHARCACDEFKAILKLFLAIFEMF